MWIRNQDKLRGLRTHAKADGRRFGCLPDQGQCRLYKLKFRVIWVRAQLTFTQSIPWNQRATWTSLRQYAFWSSCLAREGTEDKIFDSRRHTAAAPTGILLSDTWLRGHSNSIRLHCYRMRPGPSTSPDQLRCRGSPQLKVSDQMCANCYHNFAEERRLRVRHRPNSCRYHHNETDLFTQALCGNGLSKIGIYFHKLNPSVMESRQRRWEYRHTWLRSSSKYDGTLIELWAQDAWLHGWINAMNNTDTEIYCLN